MINKARVAADPSQTSQSCIATLQEWCGINETAIFEIAVSFSESRGEPFEAGFHDVVIIEACPTDALQPGGLRTVLDSNRCISYYTIEHRGEIPQEMRQGIGNWIFGCDICQDVCPWNRRAKETDDIEFASAMSGFTLEDLGRLSAEEFRAMFRRTPVWRTKYSGFLRNVAIAMGNSRDPRYRPVLERLAGSEDATVAAHAGWALAQLEEAACV